MPEYYCISTKKDKHGNHVYRIHKTIEITRVRVRFLGNGIFLYEYNWVRGEYVDPSLNAIREFKKWLKSEDKSNRRNK